MLKILLHTGTIILLGSSLTITQTPAWAANTAYVSDTLTIPMRTGTTNRHKILKFLPSGTKVTIHETSDDGTHARITTDDNREGWVETALLMSEPSAREQLAALNSKLQRVKQLANERDLLQKQNSKLEQNNQTLRNSLDELKQAAAQPIALAERNKQLTNDLDQAHNDIEQLTQQNAQLSDSSIKEWFMIGAAVSLGSLFFGLIIPRIRWRKKQSWGGGF